MATGVLGYVPGAASVLRRPSRFDDARWLPEYFESLPAVHLLRGHYERLWRVGRFTPDFFYTLGQIITEWLGVFGYGGALLLPGLRIPLPRDVIARAREDRVFFESLSLAYFSCFRKARSGLFFDLSAHGDGAPLLLRPMLALLGGAGVEYAAAFSGGVPAAWLRVTHPVKPLAPVCYEYEHGEEIFFEVCPPVGNLVWAALDLSALAGLGLDFSGGFPALGPELWSGAQGAAELLPRLFFSPESRHFFTSGRKFFQDFVFSSVFLTATRKPTD
ncbi:hypothetical protein AW736_02425 [Termitidicoccus mucosus]|uniref:Uncharacterized protein n=3 Tax=Termitidicoccus mucosus TaxID=1184151 RepID=A0A178IQR0_9BACT|nr:hypothetical protein AW736_02425 [Opitutaceae bacterium TSB47]